MPFPLRYGTTRTIMLGPFLDLNGDALTTLTIANTDIKLYKHGSAVSVNKNSGGATHDQNGMYAITLDAVDTDTLGTLEIHCHPTGSLPAKKECAVLHSAVFNALYLATSNLNVNMVSMADNVIAGTKLDATALTAISDDIMAKVVEGTLDVQDVLRTFLAVLAGISTGGGTTTINFRDQANLKNRVSATVDTSGNRSAVTLDPS